jgi:hypothetical protein
MADRKFSPPAIFLILFAAVTSIFFISHQAAAFSYFNDFEGVPATWTEWTPAVKATTPSGRHFLGSHPLYGFGNETANLMLSNVAAGNYRLEFDLFIINSWDGNRDDGRGVGPDFWKLVINGNIVLNTTFQSTLWDAYGYQSYPDNYPALNHGETGVTEKDVLGYTYPEGDVYRLIYHFTHPGGNMVIAFQGYNLQGGGDESWGLDNVRVAVNNTPIPASFFLFGSGLLGLGAFRLTKRT